MKLEPPIQTVIDATNAGDHEAFLSAFAKDAEIDDWGHVHSGRQEIARWDREENTGARRTVTVQNVSRLGDETLVMLEVERGDVRERATYGFRLHGNRVAHLEIG